MTRNRFLHIGFTALAAVLITGCFGGRAWAKSSPKGVRSSSPPTETRASDGSTWRRPAFTDARRIQVAILLDTSGSMEGLINQARTELWQLVTELAKARDEGKPPKIEIALYAYGEGGNAERGYIRQIAPFTDELDRLSEQLFALQITGSEEYCGQAIQTATRDLDWSTRPDDLRLLFIAGNEPFSQGPVNPTAAVKEASGKGIVVNTIHCGDKEDGIAGGWQSAALAAGGRFLDIDHNAAIVEIAAPQDAEIAELSRKLNETYVPYGSQGAAGSTRQRMQDQNASSISTSNAASRALAKAGRTACTSNDEDCDGYYDNSTWDLLDAVRHQKKDLGKLTDAELPPELRGKTAEERAAWIQAKQNARNAIQERIRALGQEREKYLAEARAKDAARGGSVNQAMIDVVHQQAARANLTFQ